MKNTFQRRKLRICVFEADKILLTRNKVSFESLLRQFQSFEIVQLSSLESDNFHPCDLLIISAMHLAEEDFCRWIRNLHSTIESQGNVWTPAVIVAEVSFTTIRQLLDWATEINWYFDVILPDHLQSLAVRILNLLRIHDHLHELYRYETELNALQKRLDGLETRLKEEIRGTN